MSWIDRIAGPVLVAISVATALVLAEIIFALLPNRTTRPMFEHRYLLFSNGEGLFRNEGRIFTYVPGSRFRAVAYYDVKNDWVREYDYTAVTNNEGLVQRRDIIPDKPSILFLGDSFTEGVGAPPWMDDVAAAFPNSPFQFINGGMLGTGPAQWLLLHDYLVDRAMRPVKVVVAFISDDFLREVWNHPPRTMVCIKVPAYCVGDENYHGMPAEAHLPEFLERLRQFRKQRRGSKDWKTRLVNIFPATHLSYRTAKELAGAKPAAVRLNEGAVRTLIDRYKSNVVFIHLPQKDEIMLGRSHRLGLQGREFIRSHGGEVVEGERCQLTLSDYFRHDAHPNLQGYEKIGRCVQDIIQGKWPSLSGHEPPNSSQRTSTSPNGRL